MFRKPARRKVVAGAQTAGTASVPSPVDGWNARDPLALMKSSEAIILDNWIPRTATVETRSGAADHVTELTGQVRTLLGYHSVTGNQLFAATDTGLFNVTSPGTAGAAVLAISAGRLSQVNFNTTAGSFLVAVNGVDKLMLYNGTAWSFIDGTSSPIAITGVPTQQLTFVTAFKRRLWFVKKESMSAYYLPVGSLGGALVEFPLGQTFLGGGRLVAMQNWTIDGGNGPEDYFCFVSSQGEVAVYSGSNPDDAANFSLVGVFYVAPPLGDRCFLRYGSDILMLTENGAFPLSAVLSAPSADRSKAISDRISQAFANATSLYKNNLGWQAVIHPTENLLVVNIPTVSETSSVQYVMNTMTKRWCRFTGWDAACWIFFQGALYFGGTGKVVQALTGTADFGENILFRSATAFDYLKSRGRLKHFRLVRPTLRASDRIAVNIGLTVDFREDETLTALTDLPTFWAKWDSGVWDLGVWGPESATEGNWRTVAASPGYAVSFRMQVSSRTSTLAWSATDYVFEVGGVL